MTTSRILLGFVVGAAIGGLLGVLFAPDKGENTRKKIIDGSRDFTDSMKGKLNDLADGVKQGISSLRKSAEDVEEQSRRVMP